jgi:D-beta-D-heptose 7-phosphate kinase/D-beta-D-heptose 1-phosphate adenosyltransferase
LAKKRKKASRKAPKKKTKAKRKTKAKKGRKKKVASKPPKPAPIATGAKRKPAAAVGRFDSIIAGFRKQKILVIGDLMVDRYIWGDVERISPEAPVPVVKVKGESFGLGGAANVAENLVDLGASVMPLGVVGNDEEGQWILNELRERGMDTDYIIKHPTRNTTTKTRIIARSQQMVRVDKEVTDRISSTLEAALAGYLHSLMGDIDCVVVSDYGKGVVTSALMKRVVQEAKAKKKMVFVDPKLPNFRAYTGCTAITPNHYEAASFLGTVPQRGERLKGIGKDIMKILGCEAVLITRGRDGMSLFIESGKVHNIPTMARDVFDVTGAGDTVISVFALAACAGANWLEAARIANYAAGAVIRKVGAATVTQDELSTELSKG